MPDVLMEEGGSTLGYRVLQPQNHGLTSCQVVQITYTHRTPRNHDRPAQQAGPSERLPQHSDRPLTGPTRDRSQQHRGWPLSSGVVQKPLTAMAPGEPAPRTHSGRPRGRVRARETHPRSEPQADRRPYPNAYAGQAHQLRDDLPVCVQSRALTDALSYLCTRT